MLEQLKSVCFLCCFLVKIHICIIHVNKQYACTLFECDDIYMYVLFTQLITLIILSHVSLGSPLATVIVVPLVAL